MSTFAADVMAAPTRDDAATSAAWTWWIIKDRIARFLPRNEVACSLRGVDKATAAMLRSPEFTTMRLSEPVPHHAFAWRWGRPGATRELTLAQRRELLCLTAASGATENLALVKRVAGCRLTAKVCYAAGKAGQLEFCALLAQLGFDMGCAVEGAAAVGHLALCEELMSWAGVQYSPLTCAVAAAEAGHTHIVEWMVRRCEEFGQLEPSSDEAWDLVRAIAKHCDLAALQRFLVQLAGPDVVEAVGGDWGQAIYVMAAAAGSPTPDWRAKVEWLESLDFPQTWHAFTAAAKRPDALERFAWLAQREYPQPGEGGHEDLVAAATVGNEAAVLFLAEGRPDGADFTEVWCAAAEKRHLPVLQKMHAAGRRGHVRDTANAAARNGHLHVLTWLVETPDLGVVLHEDLFEAAAASGSVGLLAWLRERGCPWDVWAFTAAAAHGCGAALEWMAERGCPMPDDGYPFTLAAAGGDMATEKLLRQLGCPPGPPGA
ncbi:hypothetical protein GPECTOR_56g406 [Gonium pectorale]|uniref:Ankyrin repeat domain-containing protein n=1 Tax=Gonium pectorale TaxID=33097 RepID=A0A150G600_GONPE|nr:hypothetical protein GPECTOR_56g406 [Gonium pectorale]|eukprot:KXZ45309.1 hypothetical protein GPECTOR_56g406 [Gonium pectorale]